MSVVTAQGLELQNYVNCGWRRSAAAEYAEVTNPATGEVLARTPLSTNADVDGAVQAAADAFPAWYRTPPGERIKYLFKLKNLLEEHVDEIARLTTQENGKTFAEAKAELRRGIENVEVAWGISNVCRGSHARGGASFSPPAAGRGRRYHAVQFSGNDSILVPALRHCMRQHAGAETFRARTPHDAPGCRTHRKDGAAAGRRQSCEWRAHGCRGACRLSREARDQFRRLDAGGEARLCALGGQRQAYA